MGGANLKWESALKSFQSRYLTKAGKILCIFKRFKHKEEHLGTLRAQIDPSQVVAIHCNHKQGEKEQQNTFKHVPVLKATYQSLRS